MMTSLRAKARTLILVPERYILCNMLTISGYVSESDQTDYHQSVNHERKNDMTSHQGYLLYNLSYIYIPSSL